MSSCCPIVELRQYTLHEGRREPLIELFEREFIESQEAVGIKVIGQFRDLDDRNRFVWLRGFESMDTRAAQLSAFYEGPVWRENRADANATMIDSDNVLLMRPTGIDDGFTLKGSRDGRGHEDEFGETAVLAVIYYLEPAATADFTAFFQAVMRPIIVGAGARILATLVTETAPNNFPRLPVRDQECVLTWFASLTGFSALEQFLAEISREKDWRSVAPTPLLRQFMRKPEMLRLAPTRRSLLR